MGLFDRTLGVVLTADTKRFERGLDRANRKVKNFGSSVQTAKGGLGSSILMGRGGLALLGGGAAVVSLRRMVSAAQDAQVVQAKLETAVENAGISYEQYASQIDKAIQAQANLSGFDDEALADSFANMIRTTKDYNKALELNQLAADIARTKGIELAGAQSLVARVFNGSFMGVKRLGVSIEQVTTAQDALRASGRAYTTEQMRAAKAQDAVATRNKAIAQLQKTFAGQAEAYGNTSAGAADRLRVAWENLAESSGESLLPALTDVTNAFTKLLNAMGSVQATSEDLLNQDFRDKFVDAFGIEKLYEILNKFPSAGLTSRPDEGTRGGVTADTTKKKPGGAKDRVPTMTREQTLQLAQLRAGLTTGLKDDLAAAQALAAFYKGKVGDAKNAKERFAATQAMIQAQQDIADIQQQMADATRADAQKQKDRLKRAAEKARQAAKDLAESLRESADKFKDAVLRALDRKQDNLDTSRDIADAKKALAQAKVLGGPETIKMAKRNLEDAWLARARFIAEEKMQVTAQKGGGYSIVINGMTINGVTNVKQLIGELQRIAKQNAAPTTGRYPAHGHGGR